MPTLHEHLTDPSKRDRVLDDCVRLVDEEVDSKGGLTGVAVKTAYALVKKIKPGFVRGAVDAMLDDFSKRLDPFYQEALQKGAAVEGHLTARRSDVADALLSITDDRAGRSSNGVAKSAYQRLRPTGKKHVEEAVPRLARMIDKHSR
jgi:hypothetical protein